jgi:outer membrane immunogenic protein
MTHVLRKTFFAAPLVLMAGMASAGGLAEPVETIAPTPVAAPAPMMRGADWTGFYAGGQLGYGQLDPSITTAPTSPDGATYGVHAGYNYDFGDVILGGELDYDATNISLTSPASDVQSVLRAKVRLGYDAGAYLPYATAGVARVYTDGALDGETDGNFYGLGLGYMVSDTMVIGGEVLQHTFEDLPNNPGVDTDVTTASVRVSFQF